MAQWQEDEAGKLITRAHGDKLKSDEIYREGMELTFPDRENFYRTNVEGQDRSSINWDTAAQVSVMRAANRLSAEFTPQFQKWFEIELGPAARAMPDDDFRAMTGITKHDAKLRLERITAAAHAVFHGPGFPVASHELYLDWMYGQGGMSIDGNDDFVGEPVIFQAMPMSEYYCYSGVNGRPDRWFFWHTMRPEIVPRQWPDAAIPPDLDEMIRSSTSSGRPARLCSTCYRDYGDEDDQPVFRSEVFWLRGRRAQRIVSRQARTSRFVTPRYMTMAGENRGRGPVLFALPDIRSANKIAEFTLRAAALAVAGVYTAVEDGVSGRVQIKPYAMIRVRSNGGSEGPSLQRLDLPNRIDFGQLILDNLHNSIKQVIGDNSLPPDVGPVRSATEFVERARELVADQAGGLGRLHAEFIVPAVQRVIDIMELRQLLGVGATGLVIDQFLVQVRMLSPLARAESMAEVQNLTQFVEIVKLLLGDQVAGFEVDPARIASHLADLMNVPMEVRNDPETKARMIDAAQQLAAAAAANGADPGMADAGGEMVQ